MKTALFIMLMLWGSTSDADERYVLWTASALAIVADWGTTLDIQHKSPNNRETNRIMGERPSQEEVNRYFTGIFLAHVFAAYGIEQIPNKYKNTKSALRHIHAFVIIGTHGYAAKANLGMGLRINF